MIASCSTTPFSWCQSYLCSLCVEFGLYLDCVRDCENWHWLWAGPLPAVLDPDDGGANTGLDPCSANINVHLHAIQFFREPSDLGLFGPIRFDSGQFQEIPGNSREFPETQIIPGGNRGWFFCGLGWYSP